MHKLTLQQRQILIYISKHPHASNIEIAKSIGINTKQGISYHVNRLIELGFLVQIKRWKLTKRAVLD